MCSRRASQVNYFNIRLSNSYLQRCWITNGITDWTSFKKFLTKFLLFTFRKLGEKLNLYRQLRKTCSGVCIQAKSAGRIDIPVN